MLYGVCAFYVSKCFVFYLSLHCTANLKYKYNVDNTFLSSGLHLLTINTINVGNVI